MRRPLVIGNWKLNGNKYMVNNLIVTLLNTLGNIVDNCDIAIAPPAIYLDLAKYYLQDSHVALGAQNVDIHLAGAFTGEISAEMLKDIGVQYVIIGHSERRIYHRENDEFIAKKFVVLKELGLVPVLCIGESEAENKAGQTEVVCARQIDVIVNSLGINSFVSTVVAYEPIWAIGTGKVATPSQAQIMHKFIRNHIAQYDIVTAKQVTILYGGSVNTTNVVELVAQPDIDGVLVGNASLQVEAFVTIAKIVAKAKQFC